VVAIAAGKNDDADSHSGSSQFTSPDRRDFHFERFHAARPLHD
jgi:hypothetical protein